MDTVKKYLVYEIIDNKVESVSKIFNDRSQEYIEMNKIIDYIQKRYPSEANIKTKKRSWWKCF